MTTEKMNIHLYKKFCSILDITTDSDLEAVKKRYRDLVKQLRPDVRPESAARFQEVKTAYDYVKRYHARAQALLNRSKQYERTGKIRPDWDFLRSFQEDFQEKHQEHTRNIIDTPLTIHTDVDFSLCVLGGEKSIEVEIADPCSCLNYHTCANCKSTGLVRNKKRINLKIPAGTRDGQTLIIKNLGDYNKRTHARGDIAIIVRMLSDPSGMFTRQDLNLIARVGLDYAEAVLGGEFEIPTLAGFKTITLKPGTQNDTSVTFAGLGVQEFAKPHIRGDLIVNFYIKVPQQITDTERQLITQLHELRSRLDS